MIRPTNTFTAADLSVCHNCGCKMVYPIDWVQGDELREWISTCRCPNCEAQWSRRLHEEAIEDWDDLLDGEADALVRNLRDLTYANMATETRKFIAALNADAILPEDFGVPQ